MSDKQFYNVGETWMLYDTVMLGEFATTSYTNVPGWSADYAALATQTDINFFNVRNRTIGLPYNNQDTRDQMPYGFYIDSIGVSFFATGLQQYPEFGADYTFKPEDFNPHIFCNDLPRHCSLTLKVNQDERLKTTVPLCPAGYGPMGDAIGRGQPRTNSAWVNSSTDSTYPVITTGMPQLNNRWLFPYNLEVPRRAAIGVTLKFTEFARQMLANMVMGLYRGGVSIATGVDLFPYAGIQVSLNGRRLVQQRGQYHA